MEGLAWGAWGSAFGEGFAGLFQVGVRGMAVLFAFAFVGGGLRSGFFVDIGVECFVGFGPPVVPLIEGGVVNVERAEGFGDLFAVGDDLGPGAAVFETTHGFLHWSRMVISVFCE